MSDHHPWYRRGVTTLGVFALAAAGLSGCNADAGTGLWLRSLDPVVLTGAAVPDLVGVGPQDVVAFRWNRDQGAWEQVPVQVDERHLDYLTKLRDGAGTSGPQTLAYSDPSANAGADPVSTLDNDDEVAFMADDTGGPAPGSAGIPASVVAGSGVRVTITDPLAGDDASGRGLGVGYVYLFERSGTTLSPGAGRDYVDYAFDPTDPIGHAEDSTIATDRYSTHFSARWTRDVLRLGSGADILDRHRNLFAPGVCGRSEDTFSAGGGGYATNVDGPVRAIRSYLGANSGTYTQREHVFYRGTERVQTFLRVHAIPGIIDFYDYSAAALGMQHLSSSTLPSVTIDGVPDAAGTAAPSWEAVTGTPGTLVSTTSQVTDIAGMAIQSYYTDDSTPPFVQCTGDAFEYGASGTAITSAIPNTDPTLGVTNVLTATRWNVYVPSTLPAEITTHVANLGAPLTTAVAPFG
ncbi:MAG: hypothetical protein ABL966_00260 [Acidimicrobiales bacterium]